jgi:uncharacterized protein (TIGR02246 family)
MRTTTCLAAFLGAMVAMASSAAATGPNNEQRLRELDKQWSEAAGSKDAARTASFYAEDGLLLPYGAPIVKGRAKIQETWAKFMATPGYALHFEPTSIVVAKSGDVAYDVGTFEFTVNDAQGKPVTEVGKYLVAWSRQKNGEWKVAADCFNADK